MRLRLPLGCWGAGLFARSRVIASFALNLLNGAPHAHLHKFRHQTALRVKYIIYNMNTHKSQLQHENNRYRSLIKPSSLRALAPNIKYHTNRHSSLARNHKRKMRTMKPKGPKQVQITPQNFFF
jgi:hypothetical protein